MNGPRYSARNPLNSIFARSTIFSSIVVCLTVIVCTASLWGFMSRVLFEDLTERAKVITRNLELSISASMAIRDYPAIVETCQEIVARNEELNYIVIAPNQDRALAFRRTTWSLLEGSAPWETAAFKSDQASIVDNPLGEGESLRYAQRITYETLNHGWVHIGYDTRSYRQHLDNLYAKTIWLGALTLLIGIVGAFVFSLQLIRPIKKLQDFAGKIAGGDLDGQIVLDHHGELSELAGAMNWMSKSLKQSRTQLEGSLKQEASLREKEILLREIHHRVKNNMQILGSLIRMQGRRVSDLTLRSVFRESENRIRSMALIHEKLYQSESLSQVALQSYLEDLTRELLRVYGDSQAGIKIDAEGVMLELDSAVPCGLIVNELVSNALKYAFPTGQKGSIFVHLEKGEQGSHKLSVWDDGVGLPEGIDIQNTHSLGLRLVGMLVDQLNGQYSYSNGVGSHFKISFDQSSYRERV